MNRAGHDNWDSKAVTRVPGARWLVIFDIEKIIKLPAAVSLRWEADAVPKADRKDQRKRDVISFVFEARDGGSLDNFEAGQHLPIELEMPGSQEPVRRTCSLSGAPNNNHYRISVKREPRGFVSRHLHDIVESALIPDTGRPAGEFMMSCNECPVVLVSAGIGITPMVSILHALAGEESERQVWFIHGVRDGDHHPLTHEVWKLAAKREGIRVHVAYSRPRSKDQLGVEYDSEVRVDGALLASLTDDIDAHYFLCGSTRFMADIQFDLERRNIPTEHIHSESFGRKD